jgi:lipopolysaccharide export system protein LptA
LRSNVFLIGFVCVQLVLLPFLGNSQVVDSLQQVSQDSTFINTADSTILQKSRDFRQIRTDTSRLGVTPRQYIDSLNKVTPRQRPTTTDSASSNRRRYGESQDIETTINYNAKDSIFFDLKNQSLKLYGDTHIDYGNITLEASRTDVDMYRKTINSIFTRDTTGRKIGKPIFSEGTDVYETDKIVYNYDTKRAQIRGVVTEQDGAFMHGDNVRKNEEDEIFIRNAKYTTCDLANPHFHIESKKLKVIPNNKVISGPFNLKFGSVNTPLYFPFGMFPQPKQRVSGILFPQWGEERRRGFFLREGGYYWAINEHIDLRATGSIYSKGATGLNVTSNYRVRYKFSGSWNFTFNQNKYDEIDGGQETKDFWVRWNHRQESRGSSNFSASVSMGTSTFNQNTNLATQDFNRSINPQFSSNVTYSKRFQGTPFNMTLNARQNQNLQTGIATLSAPELTLNMSRQYPFKNFFKNANNPIAKINFSHNFTAKNELTNAQTIKLPSNYDVIGGENIDENVVDFWQDFDEVVRRGRIGGRHQLPISTSIPLGKFTLNPNFNYQEVWYKQELDFSWDEQEEAVRIDTLNRFSRAGSWSSGASVNTIIYGTYFFKGKLADHVQAIRHVMTPSVSFSYSPDFSSAGKGVYEYVQINPEGDSVKVSKYQNFIYGSPTGSESRSLGFSLQNNLEMKVRDKEDTTGTGFKKVKVFDNLSFSSGYNFAADSFQLSNISFNTRTSFFKKALSVAINGSINPYQYELLSESVNASGNRVVSQTPINRFYLQDGKGIGKIERLTTSINFSLRPKGSRNKQDDSNLNLGNQNMIDPSQTNFDNGFGNDLTNMEEAELEYIYQNPDEYVDFNIPWSIRFSYSVTRNQRGFEDARITQSFSFSGDLSLTPNTKITFNSGFDFDRQTFTNTRIGINRDLHCWALSFNWVPFGSYQSFSVVIRPKSSILQDLKLQKRRSFTDFFQ